MFSLRHCARVAGVGLRPPAVAAPVPISLVLGATRHNSKLFTPVPRAISAKPDVIDVNAAHIPTQTKDPQAPLECWVDVAPSKNLIAVVPGKNYQLFRPKPSWQAPGRGHNWAETIALELLTHALVTHKYTGPSIYVRSDSAIALRVFNDGGCSVKEIEECGARLGYVSVLPFRVEGWKVGGKGNVADGISRAREAKGYVEVKCPVVIPEVLSPYVVPEQIGGHFRSGTAGLVIELEVYIRLSMWEMHLAQYVT
ncbi:hypothetical protein FRC08_005779 [Ceratobasidium sp. 394]|nr:hypothetical protein FRC08_005779 [Ceratobasidium sp. 394]KAG9101572.1 hypothetical protein FS749_005801 [Ceratobasidium sp. UAMH 11750]